MLLNINQPQERIVETEVWKDLKGLEDYYKVSNFGNIFSKRTCKVVKPALLENGYLRIQTQINHVNKRFRVHKAVAEMFVERKHSDQIYVNHIDGNKQNNHHTNLEWCTASENQRHARRNGLFVNLYAEGDRKLKPEDVKYIRENYVKGCSLKGFKGLGKMFNVGSTTIRNIVKYQTYTDVT
jgi:hypothetical protein